MKIATIFGTRPEIIRLSQVIKALDPFCAQTLIHTGQNHDAALSDIFFEELSLRAPDRHLGVRASGFAEQAGQILERIGAAFSEERPDGVLLLGDTNSGLAAIVAARMCIPVYHMEAGNRCYDDRVPEEINRRVIDHCSTVLMPYTHRSKENLLREGVERQRIFVVGNPIFEVLEAHKSRIDGSDAVARLKVRPGEFFLATLHRAENVDDPARLTRLMGALSRVADAFGETMLVSVHPRTADRLNQGGIRPASDRVRLLSPLGLFDFVHLEQRARCVLSDSGTVQEECCIFRVPSVTVRDVTERAETVEVGGNILSGSNEADVERAVGIALDLPPEWTPPAEYLEPHVSTAVAKIVLGYDRSRRPGP